MARTPLFGLVRRALLEAHATNQARLSATDMVTLRPRGGVDAGPPGRSITRRHFARLAVAGSAGVLAACASGGRRRAGEDGVIVVGAGIAGLTAAHRLRQAGIPVRVFEAQNRVGGRMFSLRDFFPDGQVCELGGELIDTGHTTIRALADELDIALDDLSGEPPDIERETWFFGGARRTNAEIVDAFRPIADLVRRDASVITREVTYRDEAGATALDRTSLAEWLDGNGVSGWIRDLLAVAYTTEYGLDVDQQSALNLLLMIGTDLPAFQIFGESDERFRVHDGNDRIPQRLADGLTDAIETNTVLEAVTRRADGRISCAFRRRGSSFEAGAADVVLALPFTLLRQVRIDIELPPAKRRAIDELTYGTNAKLMIGFSGRPWRDRYHSSGSAFTDLAFQSTWETSRGQSGTAGILTNFTGGRHGVDLGAGSAAARAAEAVDDLDRIFPGITLARRGMREVRMHWPSFPWTQGSYASYAAGQWTAFRGVEGERVGRVYFAGEHCSLPAQGFMEGGCETGERAAREILAVRGLRTGQLRRRQALRRLASQGHDAPAHAGRPGMPG